MNSAPSPVMPSPLEAIFSPKSIAIIGASEKPGSVGLSLVQNLHGSLFEGQVYLINRKSPLIQGVKTFPDLHALPEPVDLAVIVTPAGTVPEIVRQCVETGVKGAIIISAGFKETGEAGAAAEQEILTLARRGKLRLLGPNCLGIMRPHTGLNATFASGMAQPGSVGFISQSGALCTAILDWSFRANVGFSAFVSIGSMLDVGWGDLIYQLGDDPHTRSIVVYMESIGDARSFLSAAREVSLSKPIIVIKVGRTTEAAQAAASHTGSLTGSDEVLEAAFRRCGVLRVDTIQELFDMAEVLGKQPRPKGPRLAIVTNAGGPGALATDMLVSSGGQIAPLSPATIDQLNTFLPPHWSHHNPIDVIGDANPERYARAVEIAVQDPGNDGVLVILTPQSMTDSTGTAQALKPFAHTEGKPILASWMGGAQVSAGVALLNSFRIPTFEYPDAAARAFQYMWRYSYNLRGLYETPSLMAEFLQESNVQHSVEQKLQTIRASGRTVLTETESKQILKAYGFPIVETQVATAEAEAVAIAEKTGYPVVVKLHSETITHKTDVGGVHLDLPNATAVKKAWQAILTSVTEKAGASAFQGVTIQPMIQRSGYEIILGSSIDPQFGPVLLFGTGGQLVEVFRDRSLALPPLNATLARRMMEPTRIFRALQGVRGQRAVDLPALEQLLIRFSQLVTDQPWIREIDINPLLVSADRMIALDARIVLQEAKVTRQELPRLAIRPYPQAYVTPWTLKNGSPVTLRPIRPEDEPLIVHFHSLLSEETVYHRYFSPLKLSQRTAHERLAHICFIDYDRQIALVAEQLNPQTNEREILGVGRWIKALQADEAEFAIVIADPYQHQGLGTQLLRRLIETGRSERLHRLTGLIMADNRAMLQLCRHLGFTIKPQTGEPLVQVTLTL